MGNEALKIAFVVAVAATGLLATATALISLRYRKEILQAERRRAIAKLHPHLRKSNALKEQPESLLPAEH